MTSLSAADHSISVFQQLSLKACNYKTVGYILMFTSLLFYLAFKIPLHWPPFLFVAAPHLAPQKNGRWIKIQNTCAIPFSNRILTFSYFVGDNVGIVSKAFLLLFAYQSPSVDWGVSEMYNLSKLSCTFLPNHYSYHQDLVPFTFTTMFKYFPDKFAWHMPDRPGVVPWFLLKISGVICNHESSHASQLECKESEHHPLYAAANGGAVSLK